MTLTAIIPTLAIAVATLLAMYLLAVLGDNSDLVTELEELEKENDTLRAQLAEQTRLNVALAERCECAERGASIHEDEILGLREYQPDDETLDQ